MRTLVRITFSDIVTANKAFADRSLQKTILSVTGKFNPEAIYFYTVDGYRSCFMICNINSSSEIPVIAEPFFLSFNAKVDFYPVMNREDLEKGVEKLQES